MAVKSITIKGIPEETHQRLQRFAKRHRTSVNDLLLMWVNQYAEAQTKSERFDDWWDDHVKWRNTQPLTAVSAVDDIRADREEN